MLTGGTIMQLWDAMLLSNFMLNVKVALACFTCLKLHHCPGKPSHLVLISACNSILIREPSRLRL